MTNNIDTSKYLGVFDIDGDFLFNDDFIKNYSKLVDKYFKESSSEELKLSNAKELIDELVKHFNKALNLGLSDAEITKNLIYKDKLYSATAAAYASGKTIVFSNETLKNRVKDDELSHIFDTAIHEFTHVAQNIKFPEYVGVANAYNFFDETSKDDTHSILLNYFSKKLIGNLNEYKHSQEFKKKTIKIVDKLKEKYKNMPTMLKFSRSEFFSIAQDFDDFSSKGIHDSIYYEADNEKDAFLLGSYLSKQLSQKLSKCNSKFDSNNQLHESPFDTWSYVYQTKDNLEGYADFWKFVKYLTPKEFVKILQKNYEVSQKDFTKLYIKVAQSKDVEMLEKDKFANFIKEFNGHLIDVYAYAKNETTKEQILKSALSAESLDLVSDLVSKQFNDEKFMTDFITKTFRANREDLFVKNHAFFKYFTDEQNTQFLNWLKTNTNANYLNMLSPFYTPRSRGFDTYYGNFNKTVEDREGEISLFDEAFLQSFKNTVKEAKRKFEKIEMIDADRVELSELQNHFVGFQFNCGKVPKEYYELDELNKILLTIPVNAYYGNNDGIQPS